VDRLLRPGPRGPGELRQPSISNRIAFTAIGTTPSAHSVDRPELFIYCLTEPKYRTIASASCASDNAMFTPLPPGTAASLAPPPQSPLPGCHDCWTPSNPFDRNSSGFPVW
jgi:hypothetical protein